MKKFSIISVAALFAAMGLISCSPSPLYRAVTGITLNKDSLILNVGEEFVLQATITPDNATEQPIITWSSSNDNVARVTPRYDYRVSELNGNRNVFLRIRGYAQFNGYASSVYVPFNFN